MSPSTIYLVSGANRGIGLALVAHILGVHEQAFVYAGARDPAKASALKELEAKYPGRISVVKCVSGDVEGNTAFAKEIEQRHGRVDTVIANAGIANSLAKVDEVPVSQMEEHFNVNVIGTIVLFQSIYGLLKKSATPRFIAMSTRGACFDGDMIKLSLGNVVYGSTKAALNWVSRKIHFENEWLIAFPLSPGPVDTDMLHNSVRLDESGTFRKQLEHFTPPSADKVAGSLIKLIDESTREKDGGEFLHVDGTRLPW